MYDVDSKLKVDNLEEYNLDLTQNITTRRHEVKIISLNTTTFGIKLFLNINNNNLYNIESGHLFSIGTYDYRIDALTMINNELGINMPVLNIVYNDSGVWTPVEQYLGTIIYEQVIGFVLEISTINITRANSDYIEDHLFIQVQRAEEDRRVRDKVFEVRVDYDGINHTTIQSVVSVVENSFS
jgi:hypothetical protein